MTVREARERERNDAIHVPSGRAGRKHHAHSGSVCSGPSLSSVHSASLRDSISCSRLATRSSVAHARVDAGGLELHDLLDRLVEQLLVLQEALLVLREGALHLELLPLQGLLLGCLLRDGAL